MNRHQTSERIFDEIISRFAALPREKRKVVLEYAKTLIDGKENSKQDSGVIQAADGHPNDNDQ